MAEKYLPENDILDNANQPKGVEDDQRRAFLRRAALAGLPVVLATVKGRTVYATGGTASCPGSAQLSSC